MVASIWTKGATVLADVDKDTITLQEYQNGSVGQSLFTLAGIIYSIGSNTLRVYKNGDLLVLGTDYVESSSTTVTLTYPLPIADDRFAFILTVSSNTVAQQLADAQAAADAAQYYSSIATTLASKLGIQTQLYTYAPLVAGSTVNSILMNLSPAVAEPYANYFRITFKNTLGDNTGPVTICLNEQTTHPLYKRLPGGGVSEVAAGDIIKNAFYDAVYDTASSAFVLTGSLSTQIAFSELDLLRQQVLGVI